SYNDETNYGMSFPMNVAGTAAFLAFDNPPLPVLQNRQGNWKLALQPAYFSGKVDRDSPFDSGSRETGKYTGAGGAASFTYGLSDHWSFYLLAFGSSIKNDGDFVETGNPASNTDTNGYRMSGVQSSFLGVSPALAYRFGEPKEHGTSFSMFIGPCLV